jgi:septum formation protein
MVLRLILASASPARLATLRAADLAPEVCVSGVDETTVTEPTVPELVSTLARLKAETAAARLDQDSRTTIVLGCDSLLELDGTAYGKPGSAAEAISRWHRMRNRSGVLHTGHHVLLQRAGRQRSESAVASTTVHFADLTDAEIDAYVATGEPLQVAGAFTIDGLGGAFVTGIEGDHHNVVGISLPLLRTMLAGLGISWPSLWSGPQPG